jgi:hypothetical protein
MLLVGSKCDRDGTLTKPTNGLSVSLDGQLTA